MNKRAWLTCLLAVAVSACGGSSGGGGFQPPPPPPAAQFSVSPGNLTFNATVPSSAVPAAQTVTGTISGTISGTTLYVLIEASGTIIDTITGVVISGNSGSSMVTPVAPLSIGTGTFMDTLTVRACVDDSTCATGELSGSPQSIDVSYTVGSAVSEDVVAPRVVGSNSVGSVVIRGQGFGNVTGAQFGSSPATNIDVRSSSEIYLTYPQLSAGTYPISLNAGAVVFSGELVVIDDAPYTEVVLPYPDTPVDVPALLYDPERQALYVAHRYDDPRSAANSAMNRMLRFAFDGMTWLGPVAVAVPALRDIAISNSGERLVVLREKEIEEYDPTTLNMLSSTMNSDVVGSTTFMRHMALTNDGHAVIGTTVYGSGSTKLYLYSVAQRSFVSLEHRAGSVLLGTSELRGTMRVGIPAASGDGSRVVIVPEDGSPPEVMVYNASNGVLSKPPLTFSHNAYDYRPAVNRDGARMIFSDTAQTQVYDQTYTLFCTLPADTRAYAVDHSNLRAYVVNSSSQLRVFDVATDANGGACLQIGTDTPVFDVGIDPAGFGFPSSNVRMTISPNGVNLFIAGVNGVLVIPVP